jgi:hypothetical protein
VTPVGKRKGVWYEATEWSDSGVDSPAGATNERCFAAMITAGIRPHIFLYESDLMVVRTGTLTSMPGVSFTQVLVHESLVDSVESCVG